MKPETVTEAASVDEHRAMLSTGVDEDRERAADDRATVRRQLAVEYHAVGDERAAGSKHRRRCSRSRGDDVVARGHVVAMTSSRLSLIHI